MTNRARIPTNVTIGENHGKPFRPPRPIRTHRGDAHQCPVTCPRPDHPSRLTHLPHRGAQSGIHHVSPRSHFTPFRTPNTQARRRTGLDTEPNKGGCKAMAFSSGVAPIMPFAVTAPTANSA